MNNGNTVIKVWEDSSKTTLVLDGSTTSKTWNLTSMPGTLWVESCNPGLAKLCLGYTPDGQTYPGGLQNHDQIKVFNNIEMLLEKEGNTTIEAANNNSENTTIRVTAVNPDGQTIPWFTGQVDIAESGTSIYTQNTGYGAYLPSSVTISSGGTATFVAKSLAGPKSSTSKPDCAKIKTTSHPVHNTPGYVPIPQWTNDLGQIHGKANGDVYDWLETMIQNIWTTTGDLGTVFGTVGKYSAEYVHSAYGKTDIDHTTPTDFEINPYWSVARLNTQRPVACGQPNCQHSVEYTVIHEARHCYQDYLSTVDLGQPNDILFSPDNDDDQDWLFDLIPIWPSMYLRDSCSSRPTCALYKSFGGDSTHDSLDGNVQEALEKDAHEFATVHD